MFVNGRFASFIRSFIRPLLYLPGYLFICCTPRGTVVIWYDNYHSLPAIYLPTVLIASYEWWSSVYVVSSCAAKVLLEEGKEGPPHQNLARSSKLWDQYNNLEWDFVEILKVIILMFLFVMIALARGPGVLLVVVCVVCCQVVVVCGRSAWCVRFQRSKPSLSHRSETNEERRESEKKRYY